MFLKTGATSWTVIQNVYENDTYELIMNVYNNGGLSAATMKHLFNVETGSFIAGTKPIIRLHQCIIY